MGNSQQNGLEENFCKEIDKEDMMMLRIELTTADPSRALNQLGLEAYHMPYYVEENQNQNGHVWKSYHDLVGEIDSSVPASLAWRCAIADREFFGVLHPPSPRSRPPCVPSSAICFLCSSARRSRMQLCNGRKLSVHANAVYDAAHIKIQCAFLFVLVCVCMFDLCSPCLCECVC